MYYVYVERMFYEMFQDFKKAEDFCLLNAERYDWQEWHIQGEQKQILKSSKEKNPHPRLS